MSELLPSLQPIIDRIAAEATIVSLVLFLTVVWCGAAGFFKSRRIEKLTDQLISVSQEAIRNNVENTRALDDNNRQLGANTQAINILHQTIQKGAS